MIARGPTESGSSLLAKPVRRRYDLHPPGLMFVFTAVFLAIGAFNSQNNLLFWAFGLAVGAVVISGVVSGMPLMSVRLAREPIGRGQGGHATTLAYRVENGSRSWPVFALTIEEKFETGTNGRKSVRARTGIAHAGPGEVLVASATVHGLNRGRYALSTVVVSTTFPFGLIRKSLVFELPGVLLVRPAVAGLRREVSQVLMSPGLQSLRSRNVAGSGDEFFGLREYAPGDPIRTIAWKASARTETLVVRQTMTPAPPRIWIGLDKPNESVSAFSMESAISLVASLAMHADRIGLSPGVVIGWAGFESEPAEASGAIGRLLDALAQLDLDTDANEPTKHGLADVTVGFGSGGSEQRIDGSDPSDWAADEITVFVPEVTKRTGWRRLMRRAGAKA